MEVGSSVDISSMAGCGVERIELVMAVSDETNKPAFQITIQGRRS